MKNYKKALFLTLPLSLLISCTHPKTAIPSATHSVESTKVQVSEPQESKNSSATLSPVDTITTETYHVHRDHIKLYGELTAPSDFRETKRPLMIMAHGFNNTLEMYENYANYWAHQGYIVYRFDFFGGSRQSKSGGTDMLSMSVLTELSDLTAVINQLSKENFVDSEKIHVLGVSQGGVVATLYAAEHPEQVHKLILLFPAFVLFDDVQETYQRLNVSSVDELPTSLIHRNAQLGSIYIKDAMSVNIQEKQEALSVPTLIVHGTDDEVVPYRYAQIAVQNMQNAQLVTVENGRHWLDRYFTEIPLPAINQFLSK